MIEETTISLFGGVIAAIMALYTIASALIVRKRERRQRATELYSECYTGEFYRFSVLPTYKLLVKLRSLEGQARADYLLTIAQGWVPPENPIVDRDNFITLEEQALDPSEAHYRCYHSTEQHTEHDALVMFLNFWVRVDRLVLAGLVDRGLLAELFGNSFTYYDEFLEELAEATAAICEACQPPAWIAATRRMQTLFATDAAA